jgi:hypothetical protein
MIDTDGIITTVAGTGESGFSGDGGLATQARLSYPHDVFVDRRDNLFIADTFNNRIRKVGRRGIITTVVDGTSINTGDHSGSLYTHMANPIGLFVHEEAGLFIADTFNHRIIRVDWRTGELSTLLDGLEQPAKIFVNEQN